MRYIVLAIALVLIACTHPAPQQPQPAPVSNAAEDYAHSIVAGAQCLRVATNVTILTSTGQVLAKQPDTAICNFGQLLAFCTAGEGAEGSCPVFADLRTKQPEQPKTEPAPQPQPTATPSPTTADAKPEATKPAPKGAKK